jgi:glycosyltransferase involved in cell wall biosynthesis
MSTKDDAIMVHILFGGLGGHRTVLVNLIEGRFGVALKHWIVFIGIESPSHELVELLQGKNCEVVHLPLEAMKSRVIYQLLIFVRLVKIWPSRIFVHGLYPLVPVSAYRCLRKICHQPVFVLLRDTQAHSLKSKVERWLLKLALLSLDKVVFLTSDAKNNQLSKRWLAAFERKIQIIPNGIDTHRFKRSSKRSTPASQQVMKIGMVARLQSNKDHPTLLVAFNSLVNFSADFHYELHIAGDGDSLPDLVSLSVKLGLTDNIFFHGQLGSVELCRLFDQLDIYVHATHGETLSTSILQAMAYELPIVASHVDGIVNVVKPAFGLTYTPGNALELASHLHLLSCDPCLRRSLGISARDEAERFYSSKMMVLDYESCLSL